MTTIQDDRRVDFSDHFVLSSGTVAVDLERGLVLLLFYRPTGEYLLPKGRKNVGETLEAAAERETWEESGYTCRLFRHSLPTRAPQPTTTPHTEPIAVQQRFSQGILKIIFWYLALVDSSDRQAVETQEEGEDFEVRWVRREDAPSTMSFVDDQEIVERALRAVPCRLRGLPQSISPIRDWLLDSSVDAQALGFLCIFLGGSLVYGQLDIENPQEMGDLTDWDGFGIVERKEDIVRLINVSKSKLCALLRIEKEECPQMKLPDHSQLHMGWDVLRFSGWTKQGSKRTIKIWSKTSFCQVVSQPFPSYLGVISYKVVRFTRRDHPTLGPRLFIYQPTRATEQLHVLHDFDFLAVPEPDSISSTKGHSYKAISPGVSCDLFVTSLCVFEHEPGVMASFKARILQKWQLLSGADELESIVPLFYRGTSFGHSYSHKIRTQISEIEARHSEDARRSRTSMQGTLGQQSSLVSAKDASGHSMGYRGLYLLPLQWRASAFCPEIGLFPQGEQLCPTVCGIQNEGTVLAISHFSSNSTGSYAEILTSDRLDWQKVYIKSADSVQDELAALPLVQYYFPRENVQVLAAAQPDLQRIFFQRFIGETLNDTRLRYHYDKRSANGDATEKTCFSDEWFINLELCRARDALAVYLRSFGRAHLSNACPQQRIHKFFHHRLVGNRRLRQFYGEGFPQFFAQTDHGTMSLEAFSDLPMVINGRRYQNLRHHLDRALVVLDPNRIGGLNSLPTAFGMGDGHGGNVMISKEQGAPSILYVDYEVAGTHTPFLDLAKPIYQDGFFSVAYADLLHDDLTHTSERDGVGIKWRVEEGTIFVDYDLALQTLSKGVAVIKSEYLLRPMLEELEKIASSLRETAEETLAYSLFSCALLTRDYSMRPDVFFLNLAVGIRLATEIRKVFLDLFDWYNWAPCHSDTQGALQPAIGGVTSKTWHQESQNTSTSLDLSCSTHSYTRPHSITTLVDLIASPGGRRTAEHLPKRMSDLILKTLNDLSPTLDPDFIYLKRELDTLSLHRRFSKTPGESVMMVTQRISDTRKKAMKIAPHTCIRECLFAESRIDRHFAYRQVLLSVAQTPSKTLIDVGCCMATDIRTLITHGYPISNITGLDYETGFIQLSFSLYNQSQYSFGAQFRVADVLDPRFRERCGDLDSKFDFVHTANVIHLYDEAQQEVLLRALAFLVKPGGLVWGRQVGIEERSIDQHRQPEGKGVRFTMNQFRRLWLAATGWETESGQFEAILTPYDELRTPRKDKRFSMQWSIRAPVEAPTRRLVELINPMGCT